jgi:hypothetical protein
MEIQLSIICILLLFIYFELKSIKRNLNKKEK